MSYTRNDPTVHGNDGKPMDSATEQEVKYGNVTWLMAQSPYRFAYNYPGTDLPVTAESSYTNASWLVRWNLSRMTASGYVGRCRYWTIQVYIKVSGGATCKVRAVAGPSFRAIADPPVLPDLESEATGITSATGEWKSLNLLVTRVSCGDAAIGKFADDPMGTYDVAYLGLQACITAGAGNIELISAYGQQDSPT